ncbi:hypothetical protein ASPZODRAFT_60475 [Penicilliopsis zonata CBS 506.65]|uniref:BRCT domain-containing protein n=1 Tax=Penicilliopsis zonata CBS 506.65 TaxID=1073090 RepID=A0A1L9SQK3_9EURO|nr:hypothetical protein ASPZODRAFT_60475 [Penicilliopsis zonata CBS 506.65]OJJ49364.1 hypothetical protein ASPZODRAFT_60475 [Penicilliopsis zonata CBS 506.65]
MADDKEDVQLFGQCKACIICSKDLDQDTAQQHASLIEENGGDVVIYEPPSTFPPINEFTHIISYTIDFAEYETACDALIPVVKPEWLHMSLAKKKLANPRQHSPDPRLFLNDVVVTCGDIPEGDKDAIIGGVLAKGGVYNARISGLVTHLVDLTVDSDKARLILTKKLNVKIVLPHWFDDCLKLGRRIDERPYTLPDPEILRSPPGAPIRSSENKDIVGASTPEPSVLPNTAKNQHKLDVFEGKQIMLSPDLGIGPHLKSSIEELIEQAKGTLTSDVTKADMLICRYREGVAYRVASRLNKDVGNLSWLYHMLTFNTWTSPLRRLLHYPVSRTKIPGFEGLRISLSNYVGEARAYLENLIAATGAECTKTLKQDNTHLITAHGNSEKCTAAREWGMDVVNHLWLEESYSKWKKQSVTDPRYTHFPKRTNLGEIVGQTRLDKTVLESLFFPSNDPQSPRNAIQNKGQNSTTDAKPSVMLPRTEKTTKSEGSSRDTDNATPRTTEKTRRIGVMDNVQLLTTPARSRIVAGGKENDTPSSTSSRKSKETAAARLQEIAPDIALYEKEMKRVGGVIYGGRRKTDEDRISIGTKKRRSVEPLDENRDEENATDSKRQKKSRCPVSICLLITGYQKWVQNPKKEDADKRQLRELGIMVVQDARKCTHLAAPSILRTPKFVSALAYGPAIVSTDFITQCLKKDELLDPSAFPLQDKASEEKFGFSLAEATIKAKRNKNKLLDGYRIYCVESIRGGFDTFKSIVEANGGKCAIFRGRITLASPAEDSEDDDDMNASNKGRSEICLLSSQTPDHSKLWPRFRQMVYDIGRTPRIVHVDWLLDIAMSQELHRAEEYELSEDSNPQADH